MITDDQVYASFKNVWGTPQHYHNMMLDGIWYITFFLTFFAAEFKLIEIMQVVARQYGEQLSADRIQNQSYNGN